MTPAQRFAEIINEVRHTVSHLNRMGYPGVDCSKESLKILKRFSEKPKPKAHTVPSLESVRQDMGLCVRCKLHTGRNTIVFGSGNPRARLVFVGEAPGSEEDEQGLPFVGPAGQLLTKIIEAIHLSREDVYICNAIKCRPPGNRKPEPDEIAACLPFLEQQIAAVNPDFICALGTIAAQSLLRSNISISELRGKFFDYKGAKLIPTFHPSYLLRYPAKKREVWEDMKLLMKEYS